jgi:hypothetical protein
MQFSPLRRVAFAALLAAGTVASFAQSAVTPPPLPLGSTMARPAPGLSEPERKRYVRAHHNKFHYPRDYTKDDSVHGMQQFSAGPAAAGSVPGVAARGGAAVQGGAGTRPAREKTDRGASSWFFGKDKK